MTAINSTNSRTATVNNITIINSSSKQVGKYYPKVTLRYVIHEQILYSTVDTDFVIAHLIQLMIIRITVITIIKD